MNMYKYPKPTLTQTLLALGAPLIMIALIIAMGMMETTHYKTDGPWLKVKEGAKLISYFGNDTVKQNLAKGDSVKFLGFDTDSFLSEYLVETPDGERGYVYNFWVDVPMVIKSKKYYGDTMRIQTPAQMRYESKYGYRYPLKTDPTGILLKDGRKINIQPLKFVPAVDGVMNYEIGTVSKQYNRLMSQKKFEKKAENLHLDKAEEAIGPMMECTRLADGSIKTLYRDYIFNSADGKFYLPIITFGPDSIATSTGLAYPRDRGDWLLKYMPLASTIYDMPLTSFLSRTSLYNYNGFLYNSNAPLMKGLRWVLGFLFAVAALVWMLGICIIPLGIFFYMLFFPRILFSCSDVVVKGILGALCVVFTYYWMVVLLAWGVYWWMLIILISAAYGIWEFYTMPLEDSVPHDRCQKCRAMFSMELVDQDFLDSNYGTEHTSRSEKIAENRTRTKHYTEVSRNGYKIREEDVHYTTDVETTYRTHNYKEKVRYDNYMIHYRCSVCGHKERKRKSDRNVLDRTYKGSETHTEHRTLNY